MIKINWLMLFKEIIAVYSENHTKPTDTLLENAELLNIMAGSTYSNQWSSQQPDTVPYS
jgi:hypothetical protein